jgi:hypothetical protein
MMRVWLHFKENYLKTNLCTKGKKTFKFKDVYQYVQQGRRKMPKLYIVPAYTTEIN